MENEITNEITNENTQNFVCCICLEETNSSENFIQSECDCKVWCHGTCLAGWLMKGNGGCPQCRKQFDKRAKIQNEQAEFLRSIMNVIEPFLNIEEPKPKKIIRSDKMCNGCKKFIKIEDIEKHYEECKINCERCNKIVFYKEKLEHYKECKIHCEWCDKEILFCEKYKHKCKKY